MTLCWPAQGSAGRTCADNGGNIFFDIETACVIVGLGLVGCCCHIVGGCFSRRPRRRRARNVCVWVCLILPQDAGAVGEVIEIAPTFALVAT